MKERKLGKKERKFKKPQGEHSGPATKIILCAVTGMSPAVLTETVWALAHQTPAVIPDEVIVITTKIGKDALCKLLFGSNNGWQRLRQDIFRDHPEDRRLAFGESSDSIKLIPSADKKTDLDDLRTPADNMAAADFMLKTLRGVMTDDTTVYASIAGGRKTMGALMLSCMSLLGRKDDHVLHVLVEEKFEKLDHSSACFLFPERGKLGKTSKGEPVKYSSAKINLIDLPFVKMRDWYEGKFRALPPTYERLVQGVQACSLSAIVRYPDLRFSFRVEINGQQRATCVLEADGVRVNLSPLHALVLAVSLCDLPQVEQNLKYRAVLAERVWQYGCPKTHARFGDLWRASTRFEPAGQGEDENTKKLLELTKFLNEIRGRLNGDPRLAPLIDKLVPPRGAIPSYPKDHVHADIKALRALAYQ